ncbi:WecB/TagA/CpsF family glycosyltransferase [Synechococcus sp. PCC 7335]|uniref:WecB/TagA/CpsF family glycosyltransferase n=1 Tax=Synechococcus sp. (strain ATCC 29403 / PCC 7335) TaxID=91464 RepID=UPI000681D0E3|nr:WecB/TagA/CpsF family glycosyltransferase [Synechococcus sp. PCC 7335]
MKPQSVEVIGLPITALRLSEQVNLMVEWGKQRLSKVVCVANVHMLVESQRDNHLRSILNRADLVTPDGMPLVWMMRSLGEESQDRVAGMDIFETACKLCQEKNVSIYLIGSTKSVLDTMEARLHKEFPDLKIAGLESPPFRPLSNREDEETVERINRSGAGITFVSLGCPKQERWMEAHRGRLNSVMVGVGAVFPVYAGLQKRAPKWTRELGLEWLYRLVQEPQRLFGRYFNTIPPFVYLAVKQLSITRKPQRRLVFSKGLRKGF